MSSLLGQLALLTLQHQLAQPQVKLQRQLKEEVSILKGLQMLCHQPTHQQKTRNCKAQINCQSYVTFYNQVPITT